MKLSRSLSFLLVATLFVQALPGRAAGVPWPDSQAGRLSIHANGPPIELLNGAFVPQPGVDLGLRRLALAAADQHLHVLLQMDHIPTAEERAALARHGVELQVYVPQQAWIARVPAARVATLAAQSGFRWIGPWDGRQKIHPRAAAGDFGPWGVHESGRVQLMVLLHADVSLVEGQALVTAHGGIVAGSIGTPRALTAWMKPESLPALAAEDGVMWIEASPPPLTPNNDGVRQALRVDPLHGSPYNLDGDGVGLFVFDGGRIFPHPAFAGRLTSVDNSGIIEHATHVAGTAAGDGSGSPSGRDLKGVAPAAHIYSAGFEPLGETMLFRDNSADIEQDFTAARNTYAVDLATASIGSNAAHNNYPCEIEGDYGVSSSLIDGIVRGDNASVGSPVITLWASGNERTGGEPVGRCGSNYATTAPPSCAKNPIHVGGTNTDGDAMTSFSSWGPCDDGRLKPTVSGPGCETGRVTGESFINSTLVFEAYGDERFCGTSMAAPAVAGVATLAIQHYRSQSADPTARPSNALMKAWMIHTARDLGNDGPDYVYGYGEVDALSMMNLISSTANYTASVVASTGVTEVYTYAVPFGASAFKISLAWDDAAAAVFAATALVNNLDLEVAAPDGKVYYPFALDPVHPERQATATGPNTRDNQEQIVILDPAPGTWTIRVRGMAVPLAPQSYALAYTHQVGGVDCSQGLVGGDFESGGGDWVLSGADLEASPGAPPAGGSVSLRLGGSTRTNHDAYQAVTVPADIDHSAGLSFDWYMITSEGSSGYGWDHFVMEVRDTSNNPLAVYDVRNDGWLQNRWLKGENIDVKAFAGQTIRVAFHGTNDTRRATTFYVDNVELLLCRTVAAASKIDVFPSELSGSVGVAEILTQTLAVRNTGQADLTWAFTETQTVANAPTVFPAELSYGPVTGDSHSLSTTASSVPRCGAPWASAVPASGATPPGMTTNVAVILNANGLPADVYTGTLCIESDDPVVPVVAVPISMNVTSEADLWITKSGPALAMANHPFTYTLAYGNLGPATAYTVTLTDSLPVGLDLVKALPPTCAKDGGLITCELGDLVPDAAGSVYLQVLGAVGGYTNRAGIRSSSPDPDEALNGAVADTIVLDTMVYLPVLLR